jgi:5-methyltetrahydrofolate--homocysteine methyltransferase
VGVVGSLLSLNKEAVHPEIREEYRRVRETHARSGRQEKRLSIAAARANALPTDWSRIRPARPAFAGVHELAAYDLSELARTIDWGPFFHAWELGGRFPQIIEAEGQAGETARKLFDEARAMLDRIVDERWLEARGVVGIWPANSDGDDILVYADESRTDVVQRFHTLRQQIPKAGGRPNLALSDFVAPSGLGIPDYIGGFAVTTGHGERERVDTFKRNHDDYNAILLQTLTDRLAEAFAERLHERVRTEFWGYAPEERLTPEQLLAEAYQGIRPAPGYPSQPDHTEKAQLFALLDAPWRAGIELTESFAMSPGASVSGLYFSHPESRYFSVGKLDRDQVEDYARRKGIPLEECERWLAPALGYEPGPTTVNLPEEEPAIVG